MSEIIVTTKDETLVVDSRLVAERLGIEHETFTRTIKKYESRIEQRFGTIRFEIGTSTMPDGRINPKPEKFAWLTEDQSTFLMTLSRNTEQVIDCKANLVKAFSDARKLIEQSVTAPPTESTRILPTRDAIDYAEAAVKVESLANGLLKQLLNNLLVDQISLEQNLKYLPVAEKPKQYTIVKVRAKALGYSETQIGDGSQLGRFVKAKVQPAFQEIIGRYPVYHYEVGPEIDQAIHQFFS